MVAISHAMAVPNVAKRDASLDAERENILAALAGDGLAFRRLVEPHLAVLLRIAARVSGDRALAEDAVQETLAICYKRLPTYRHEMPFRALLTAIAARQAHTLARGERRRNRRELASAAPRGLATPDQHVAGAATAARIREALSGMPKKRREAALLRLDGGLSYREIAEALETSEGSARVLVHMAIKDLKGRLSDLVGNSDED